MSNMFYFTDIHGQFKLYNYIINWCFNKDPKCFIIYGGDAADRGPDGYIIMKKLLNNSQIIYLKGNHEELFVNAAHEIIGHYAFSDEAYNYIHNISDKDAAIATIEYVMDTYNKHTTLHVINGGLSTLTDWLLDGASEDFIDKIEHLPVCFSYNNIDFCHAGGSPKAFNAVLTAYYNGEIAYKPDIITCLWDRNCFALGWTDDRICVHGHTPTIYLPDHFYGGKDKSKKNIHPAAWQGLNSYQKNGWKIDMDTAATFTGRAFVLDIQTMNVYGFQDLDIEAVDKLNHNIITFNPYKIID